MTEAIGYWRGGSMGRLPRPQWFVRDGWRTDDRDRVLHYLRSGSCFTSWMGYSYCRFDCGVSPTLMGDSDLTDGEWVWPAGLAHYVESHSVILPDEFIHTMMRNDWTVPEPATDVGLEADATDRTFDHTFWFDWSRRNARRPWYWPW